MSFSLNKIFKIKGILVCFIILRLQFKILFQELITGEIRQRIKFLRKLNSFFLKILRINHRKL